jgi:hypothetical protein
VKVILKFIRKGTHFQWTEIREREREREREQECQLLLPWHQFLLKWKGLGVLSPSLGSAHRAEVRRS